MLMLKNENKPATAETGPLVAGDPFWEEREETYHATRQYLVRVRELTQKIALLKNRIAYREDDLFSDDSLGVVGRDELQKELADAERELKIATVQVTDLIGQLKDATQQVVMTKRYVDGKSWDAIALEMDIGVRAVQKAHGKALLNLDEILSRA